MPAVLPDVQLVADPVPAQLRGQHQAVLRGNGSVLPGVPQEGGRRVVPHKLLQRHLILQALIVLSQQVLNRAPVGIFPGGDHRVCQDHGVRPADLSLRHHMPFQADMRCGMSAGGKAHHRNPVRIAQPLFRVCAGIRHRLRSLLQRLRVPRCRRHGIPHNHRLHSQRLQPQGHRLRLPVAPVHVRAAGENQHQRFPPPRLHRPVVGQVGFQLHARFGKGYDLMPHCLISP